LIASAVFSEAADEVAPALEPATPRFIDALAANKADTSGALPRRRVTTARSTIAMGLSALAAMLAIALR